jgi:hypothetical protein
MNPARRRHASIYLEAPDQATLPYVLLKGPGGLTSASVQQVRSILVDDAGGARVTQELVIIEQLRSMRMPSLERLCCWAPSR